MPNSIRTSLDERFGEQPRTWSAGSGAFAHYELEPGIYDEMFHRDGTASREAIRRFYTSTIEPKSLELAALLSETLEAPVTFSFRSAWAHDLVGRTSALKALVDAGVPLGEALHRSGLGDV